MSEVITEPLTTHVLATWEGEWLHNRLEATLSGVAELSGLPNEEGAILRVSETYTLGSEGEDPAIYGKRAAFANSTKENAVTNLVEWLKRWSQAGFFDGQCQFDQNAWNALYFVPRPPEVIPASRIQSFVSANERGGTGEAVYVNPLGGLVINASFASHPRVAPVVADRLTSKKIIIPPGTTYQIVSKLVATA